MLINSQIDNNIIVTAYYIISNKRSSDEFIYWIKNFFCLNSFKVIYTNKYTLETLFLTLYNSIVKINKNILFTENVNSINCEHLYQDTTTNSLFIIEELEDTFIWKNYKNLMTISEKKDPEILKGINHNKYLYTIWNNKSFWLKNTLNIINARGYYWVDIGCIRYKYNDNIKNFISSLNFVNRDNTKIILSLIEDFIKTDEQYVNSIPFIYYNNNEIIRIQGGFFGGGKKELIEWSNYYIDELNLFDKYGIFSGKDQYIMGSIYLKYKYKFDIFIPKNKNYNNNFCNDIWFRFLNEFS